MPRNGTGTYTLPAAINPVIEGTPIDAPWANTTLNDLGAAVTGSLPRNGEAPMTGPLKMADGTVGAPSLSFNSDASTGFFRPGTGVFAISAGGFEQARFTNGNLILGSTTDTGQKLQVTGTTILNGAWSAIGNGSVTGTIGVSGVGAFASNVTVGGTLGVVGLAAFGNMSTTTAAASSFIERVDERAVTGTTSLNLTTSSIFSYLLLGTTTLQLTNIPTLASNEAISFVVRISQGSTAQTLNWFSGITWLTLNNVAPQAVAANKSIEYVFTRTASGAIFGRRGATT